MERRHDGDDGGAGHDGRAGGEATVVLLHAGAEVARWPLAGSAGPDLAVVDDLARLELAARRLGCSIRLCGAGPALVELLDLVGLAGVVATGGRGMVPTRRPADPAG